ncbi:protein MAINTENANCE OF MERISTEMS-like [Cryptomeria japonica]|uniref:protein MAINTENANCE OF MERISTEMS-like n=1 Tax=Cryptomeria japonica TaxID=3369 RepID=UPI0027DA4031|nr:protein MAINTENANCE OF MERISTEMS-like [Cryptomeria japonica]
MRLVRELTDVQRAHIDACELGLLLDTLDIRVNHGLLSAIVERFHPEHNTFHLPTEEMTITPEDVYRILRIPFAGGGIDYDSSPQRGITELRRVFHDDTLIVGSITWDDMLSRYGAQFSVACVLAGIIGCFVMPDRGQQGFLCGWGRMLDMLVTRPRRLGWGSYLLAHMYHEMHEIAYRKAKSMVVGLLVLQIWAWEHILVCRPIVEDLKLPHQPIVYQYAGFMTQPHLGKTDYWRRQLDDLITVVWRPYRGLEEWNDWRRERKVMFMTRPLIGRAQTIIEHFVLSRVMRQYERPQVISREFTAYVRFGDEERKGWGAERDYFLRHPFPRFTDPGERAPQIDEGEGDAPVQGQRGDTPKRAGDDPSASSTRTPVVGQ